MAAIPWFPVFASDLLMDDDLFNLDPKAEGLLLRMWCLCWVDGYAPSATEPLSLKVRRPISYVRKYLPEVLRFFKMDEQGHLWSKRVEVEREKAAGKSEKCRAAINARWEKTRKAGTTPEHTDEHTDVSTKPIPSQSPSPSPKEYPPTPKGVPGRKPRGQEPAQHLGEYPQELSQAVQAYRQLMSECRSPEILERFPADKQFLAAGLGPVEGVWKAWQKRLGSVVHGTPVGHADIQEAVQLLIKTKREQAKRGHDGGGKLAVPMLPTLINSDLFVDALVRVKELAHAS